MKIGTLTYHDTTNYGAVLQAYALQNKIQDLGYDCEIIDYKCDTITKRYEIIELRKSKSLKQFVKSLLSNTNKRKLKEKFVNFNKTYQKISSKSYDKSNINNANNDYDKFVVGSDQVWNLELSGEDTTYMLDFVNDDSKKKSYAASFGYCSIPDKYIEKTKKYLSSFENILVREEQGKKIIKDKLNKESEITLDPTLLLNKNEWDSLISNDDKLMKKDYILLYIIAPNDEIINFAKKLAKKKHCKILYINHSIFNVFGTKNIKSAGPCEFLKYIKNAKYVVTTSFHGVAFSVNFEKQFFYALSSESNNFNSRIENLVDILKLQDRKIDKKIEEYNDIDYNRVSPILEKERKLSINKLKKVLEK